MGGGGSRVGKGEGVGEEAGLRVEGRDHVVGLGEWQRFFFPVKIKRARESFFWPFFDFFHGWKMAFTHTFF